MSSPDVPAPAGIPLSEVEGFLQREINSGAEDGDTGQANSDGSRTVQEAFRHVGSVKRDMYQVYIDDLRDEVLRETRRFYSSNGNTCPLESDGDIRVVATQERGTKLVGQVERRIRAYVNSKKETMRGVVCAAAIRVGRVQFPEFVSGFHLPTEQQLEAYIRDRAASVLGNANGLDGSGTAGGGGAGDAGVLDKNADILDDPEFRGMVMEAALNSIIRDEVESAFLKRLQNTEGEIEESVLREGERISNSNFEVVRQYLEGLRSVHEKANIRCASGAKLENNQRRTCAELDHLNGSMQQLVSELSRGKSISVVNWPEPRLVEWVDGSVNRLKAEVEKAFHPEVIFDKADQSDTPPNFDAVELLTPQTADFLSERQAQKNKQFVCTQSDPEWNQVRRHVEHAKGTLTDRMCREIAKELNEDHHGGLSFNRGEYRSGIQSAAHGSVYVMMRRDVQHLIAQVEKQIRTEQLTETLPSAVRYTVNQCVEHCMEVLLRSIEEGLKAKQGAQCEVEGVGEVYLVGRTEFQLAWFHHITDIVEHALQELICLDEDASAEDQQQALRTLFSAEHVSSTMTEIAERIVNDMNQAQTKPGDVHVTCLREGACLSDQRMQRIESALGDPATVHPYEDRLDTESLAFGRILHGREEDRTEFPLTEPERKEVTDLLGPMHFPGRCQADIPEIMESMVQSGNPLTARATRINNLFHAGRPYRKLHEDAPLFCVARELLHEKLPKELPQVAEFFRSEIDIAQQVVLQHGNAGRDAREEIRNRIRREVSEAPTRDLSFVQRLVDHVLQDPEFRPQFDRKRQEAISASLPRPAAGGVEPQAVISAAVPSAEPEEKEEKVRSALEAWENAKLHVMRTVEDRVLKKESITSNRVQHEYVQELRERWPSNIPFPSERARTMVVICAERAELAHKLKRQKMGSMREARRLALAREWAEQIRNSVYGGGNMPYYAGLVAEISSCIRSAGELSAGEQLDLSSYIDKRLDSIVGEMPEPEQPTAVAVAPELLEEVVVPTEVGSVVAIPIEIQSDLEILGQFRQMQRAKIDRHLELIPSDEEVAELRTTVDSHDKEVTSLEAQVHQAHQEIEEQYATIVEIVGRRRNVTVLDEGFQTDLATLRTYRQLLDDYVQGVERLRMIADECDRVCSDARTMMKRIEKADEFAAHDIPIITGELDAKKLLGLSQEPDFEVQAKKTTLGVISDDADNLRPHLGQFSSHEETREEVEDAIIGMELFLKTILDGSSSSSAVSDGSTDDPEPSSGGSALESSGSESKRDQAFSLADQADEIAALLPERGMDIISTAIAVLCIPEKHNNSGNGMRISRLRKGIRKVDPSLPLPNVPRGKSGPEHVPEDVLFRALELCARVDRTAEEAKVGLAGGKKKKELEKGIPAPLQKDVLHSSELVVIYLNQHRNLVVCPTVAAWRHLGEQGVDLDETQMEAFAKLPR